MLKRAFFLLLLPLYIWADAHVFVYHRFGDDRYPSTSTSIEHIRSDFEYLKLQGYKVISLTTLIDALKNNKTIDDKWIVFTIDDGYKSFYEKGLPLFKEYGYPFTLFVYTKASHKKYGDFMDLPMLQDAMKYGELGLHTNSHEHFTTLNDEQIQNDIKQGIDFFTKYLDFSPKYFAYPFGEYDIRVENIVKQFGFDAVFNQNMGAVGSKSNIFCLDRCALTADTSISNYLKYEYLEATWLEPKIYPKDRVLKTISVQTKSKQKNAKLYISTHGWRDIKLDEGGFTLKTPIILSNDRTRLILKIDNKISNYLIVKKESN